MQQLHDRSLKLGKKIRALHDAGEAGLPELVAGVVRSHRGTVGSRVLLLGAGSLGREVADQIAAVPEIEFTWANRTLGNIPAAPDCGHLSLSDALDRLSEFDQVITVLGANAPVVRHRHLPASAGGMLLVDLGLPRNIEPSLSDRPGIEILNLGSFRDPESSREQLLALTHTVAMGSGVIHG